MTIYDIVKAVLIDIGQHQGVEPEAILISEADRLEIVRDMASMMWMPPADLTTLEKSPIKIRGIDLVGDARLPLGRILLARAIR